MFRVEDEQRGALLAAMPMKKLVLGYKQRCENRILTSKQVQYCRVGFAINTWR